jgi:hypothetical protein
MARIARVVMRGAAPHVTHISSPNLMLPASKICVPRDAGNAAGLVFFIFDLLHLDGGCAADIIEESAQQGLAKVPCAPDYSLIILCPRGIFG